MANPLQTLEVPLARLFAYLDPTRTIRVGNWWDLLLVWFYLMLSMYNIWKQETTLFVTYLQLQWLFGDRCSMLVEENKEKNKKDSVCTLFQGEIRAHHVCS